MFLNNFLNFLRPKSVKKRNNQQILTPLCFSSRAIPEQKITHWTYLSTKGLMHPTIYSYRLPLEA